MKTAARSTTYQSRPRWSRSPPKTQPSGGPRRRVRARRGPARGRRPASGRRTAPRLVAEPQATSDRFAELWESGAVGRHEAARKTIDHPYVGPLTLDCDALTRGGQRPAHHDLHGRAGTEDADRLALLTVVGTQALAGGDQLGVDRGDTTPAGADVRRPGEVSGPPDGGLLDAGQGGQGVGGPEVRVTAQVADGGDGGRHP
ncbi:hypothetical protein H9X94_11735 [Micromonospora aurantiaca]|nr:hypothetical protein [Micromonospora aurantiaca]